MAIHRKSKRVHENRSRLPAFSSNEMEVTEDGRKTA